MAQGRAHDFFVAAIGPQISWPPIENLMDATLDFCWPNGRGLLGLLKAYRAYRQDLLGFFASRLAYRGDGWLQSHCLASAASFLDYVFASAGCYVWPAAREEPYWIVRLCGRALVTCPCGV